MDLEEKKIALNNKKLSIIDIPINLDSQEKLNESGLNHLLDYMKNSKNKPVTEKVDKLLQVFSKNKLDDTNIKIDNNIKEILLKNLKDEFLTEKGILKRKSPSYST